VSGMQYSLLGLTGLQVSRVGFGGAAIGGYDYGTTEDKISIAAVRRAFDLGVNLFDTADVYGFGRSEDVLRKALGIRCREVIIATKVGVRWDSSGKTRRDLSRNWIEQALEASLRRLGLEAIPLYQIHWPDPDTSLAETCQTLLRCQEAGKIIHLGCCNFDLHLVDQCQQMVRLETMQLPYSIIDRESATVFEECRVKYSMSGLCYNTLAHGLFGGRYGRDSTFCNTDLRLRNPNFQGERFEKNLSLLARLEQYAKTTHRTSAQVAIQWVLSSPAITSAIIGMKTPGQAEENVLGAGLSDLSNGWVEGPDAEQPR